MNGVTKDGPSEPRPRPPGTKRLGLAIAGAMVLVVLGCIAFVLANRPERPKTKPRLRVLAAASLGRPLRAIAELADAVEIELSFAASSVHERQLESGAEADVFVAAAPGPVDRLVAKGVLDASARRVIAEGSLVVVVPAGASKPADLAALALLERIAVGAQGVPVGDYAREALRAKGLLASLEGKLASYPDEPAVLAAVENGGAPAGIVYRSSLGGTTKAERAFTVDPALHPRIEYVAAAVKSSKEPAVARAFVEGFASPVWTKKLAEAGFDLPKAR